MGCGRSPRSWSGQMLKMKECWLLRGGFVEGLECVSSCLLFQKDIKRAMQSLVDIVNLPLSVRNSSARLRRGLHS